MKRISFLGIIITTLAFHQLKTNSPCVPESFPFNSESGTALDPAERIRRECIIRTLESHVRRKAESINTIRVTLTIDKNQHLEGQGLDAWFELVRFALSSCQAASLEAWINKCDVAIKEPSNSACICFNFGSDDLGVQGDIGLTFGASDCCADCYPICMCTPRSDGTCPCTHANESPEQSEEIS